MSLSWIGQVRGPLVATPIPDRRETAIGYVLRLAQANSYHSPTAFLPKGNDTRASVRGGSARTLQKLTGMSLEWAERLAIDNFRGGLNLLGHAVGFRDVVLDLHRVCPECIEESAILDASWHLSCITHCAKHGLALVESCDACGRRLGLNRPGVGICRCDQPLIRRKTQSTCSSELLALMQALRARLYADKRIAKPPRSLPHFDQLNLVSLMAVVRAMHKHAGKERGLSLGQRQMAIDMMEVVAQGMHAFKKGVFAVQAVLHEGSVLLPSRGAGSRSAFDWYYDRQFGLCSIRELSFTEDAIQSAVRGGPDRFTRTDQLLKIETRPVPTSTAGRRGTRSLPEWHVKLIERLASDTEFPSIVEEQSSVGEGERTSEQILRKVVDQLSSEARARQPRKRQA